MSLSILEKIGSAIDHCKKYYRHLNESYSSRLVLSPKKMFESKFYFDPACLRRLAPLSGFARSMQIKFNPLQSG